MLRSTYTVCFVSCAQTNQHAVQLETNNITIPSNFFSLPTVLEYFIVLYTLAPF